MKNLLAIPFGLLCAVLVGCNSAPLSSIQVIPVPAGLTKDDVRVVIAAAAYERSKPADAPNPIIALIGNPVEAAIASRILKPKERMWFVEEAPGDSVILGYTQQDYYLRMEYRVSGQTIVPRVLSSRNLDQSTTSIHEGAIEWIQALEVEIRRQMGIALMQKNAGR
jgi:hypothetical protein